MKDVDRIRPQGGPTPWGFVVSRTRKPSARLIGMNNPDTEENMANHLDIPIRILGKVYLWRSVPTPAFSTDQIGQADHQALTITVRHDIAPQQQAETTLHEVVHAINEGMYLELDESQVSRISVALFAVLRDNPHLAEFLEKLVWPYTPEWHIKSKPVGRDWSQEQ